MLEFDLFILLAQLLNFGILYYIFQKYIAKHLSKKLHERRAQLKKLEMAEAHYEEKMALAEQERLEILKKAKKTSRDLMRESEILAKAQARAIQEKAHAEAEAILEGGKKSLEKERISML